MKLSDPDQAIKIYKESLEAARQTNLRLQTQIDAFAAILRKVLRTDPRGGHRADDIEKADIWHRAYALLAALDLKTGRSNQ